jgi:hypothetical protein
MDRLQYSSGSKMVVAERWPVSSEASVMIQSLTPFVVA